MRAAKREGGKIAGEFRSMPGRSTFTATLPRRFVGRLARCTCAIDAAAIGSPKIENIVVQRPVQFRFDFGSRNIGRKGRQAILQASSAAAISSPMRSGRVASTWPSLI